jgi:hypothetical protein
MYRRGEYSSKSDQKLAYKELFVSTIYMNSFPNILVYINLLKCMLEAVAG